jgi:hypothetical protein
MNLAKKVFRTVPWVFLFLAAAGGAPAYEDMTCPAPAGAGVCETRTAGEGRVIVTCGGAAGCAGDAVPKTCTRAMRDWGNPSPYAHTSAIWRCSAGEVETFLFAVDFDRDPVRCELVCGRCPSGWRMARPPKDGS